MKDILFIFFSFTIFTLASAQTNSVVWENQGMPDEFTILSPNIFSDPNECITLTLNWDTTTVGAASVFVPRNSAGFVSYESGTQGAHNGHCQFGINNSHNDPKDQLQIQLSFSEPVKNLVFTLLDIDFYDGVEVFFNTINIKTSPSFYNILGSPATALLDNKSYMDGFEATGSGASAGSTNGNIDFSFGTTSIATIDIVFFCTGDGNTNPDRQAIGLSDISFEPVAISPCVLPIAITDFTVDLNSDDNVAIEWTTDTEINNDYFTLEKSQNEIDWEAILRVKGAGNSSTFSNYSEVDTKPYVRLSYYRLKQTDFDGKFSYAAVKIMTIEATNKLQIFPNPTSNQITITGNKAELTEINIYNSLGQNVNNLTQKISANKAQMVLDLSNLTAEFYYLKTKYTVKKIYKQ